MKKRNTTIGMVINTALKPNRDVMLGIIDNLHRYPGAHPRFFQASPATTADHITAFMDSGLDGVMFCGVSRKVVIEALSARPDHPPAIIGTYGPLTEEERGLLGNGGTVMLDNKKIGKKAARVFIRHGMNNFAFFGSNICRESLAGDIRCDSFKRTIEEEAGEGVTFSRFMAGEACENEDYWDPAADEVEAWVKSLPLPCGVLANGDREAFFLADICRSCGIHVPTRMEIIGVNDSHELCDKASPAISSLQPDLATGAKVAIALLMSLIEKEPVPQEKRSLVISDMMLHERGTTQHSRGGVAIVTRAKDYIRENACNGISVADVASNLGVSRRTLENQVLKATGHGVLKLIRDVRIARVCKLLATTNMPISEVTVRSGYRLTTNLVVLFKRMFGMTMRQYRAAHRKDGKGQAADTAGAAN